MDDPIKRDWPGCLRLAERLAQLEALAGELQTPLEQRRRSARRQAAPFRKDKQAAPPNKPRRNSGGEGDNAWLRKFVTEQAPLYTEVSVTQQ